MTWGRLNDQAHEDERFWGLPMSAVGLYYACLSRCLWRDENLVTSAAARQATQLAQENPNPDPLVGSGLWVEVTGGWAYDFDDWESYRCPEEKRQAIAEQRSEAGRKGAAARWGPKQTHSKQMAKPSQGIDKNAPVPVPVPVVNSLLPTVVESRRVGENRKVIFQTWQESTGHRRAVLDAKRKRCIDEALRLFPVDELLETVQGSANDPWPERPQHNDITVLLRDAAHIEKFRDLYRNGPPPTDAAQGQELKRWLQDFGDDNEPPKPFAITGGKT